MENIELKVGKEVKKEELFSSRSIFVPLKTF